MTLLTLTPSSTVRPIRSRGARAQTIDAMVTSVRGTFPVVSSWDDARAEAEYPESERVERPFKAEDWPDPGGDVVNEPARLSLPPPSAPEIPMMTGRPRGSDAQDV